MMCGSLACKACEHAMCACPDESDHPDWCPPTHYNGLDVSHPYCPSDYTTVATKSSGQVFLGYKTYHHWSVCEKQGQYKVCGTAQCLPCADSSCQAEMKNRREELKAFKKDCPPGYKKARNRDRGFAAAWGPGIHNYNVCEFSNEGK